MRFIGPVNRDWPISTSLPQPVQTKSLFALSQAIVFGCQRRSRGTGRGQYDRLKGLPVVSQLGQQPCTAYNDVDEREDDDRIDQHHPTVDSSG
jgi:hypothetical protein